MNKSKIILSIFFIGITCMYFTITGQAQNVGIGINTPLAPLHIKSDNEVLRIQGITPYVSFYNNSGINKGYLQNYNDDIYLGTPSTNTNGIMQFYLKNSAVMTLNPTGQVGIGTVSPSGKLHILHPGPTAHLILEYPGLNNFSRLLFTNTGASRSWGIAGKISSGGVGSDFLSLYNTGNTVEAIAMTGDGNVGIGVSNPVNKLQIGSVGATGFATNDFALGNGTQAFAIYQTPSATSMGSTTDISIMPKNNGNGYVGINVAAPANKLQIGSVGATGFATNDFAIGNGTAAMAIYQTNTQTIIGSTTDIVLKPRNNGQGRVGINTNTPGYPLEVSNYETMGTRFAYFGLGYSNFQPVNVQGGTFDNANVSIYASNNIMALQLNAFSDARIKNIIGVSNSAKDLETINALQVTDYTLKDKVQNGDKPYKKVIAQEVEKVYPQVVSKHTDFIPNVYQVTSKVEKTGNGYLLSFTGKHNITKAAKKLRVLLPEGEGMQEVNIIAILSDVQVHINATDLKTDKVFVYGEEVDDFRAVDYEGLTTLNISATQELSKLVKKQQAIIETQQKQLALMEKRLAALETKLPATQVVSK